ncbi:unnamed protein product [Boreogadus saida]
MLTAARVARRSVVFLRSITTSHVDLGHQQATVVILPSALANDFEAFCSRNPAALSLLYRSQPGETSCLPIASNVDTRSYISQYCVFENGRLQKTVPSLKGFGDDSRAGADTGVVRSEGPGACWPDMVFFYLGSSFGFEARLREAGVPDRNVEQGKNGMYKTAVPCVPVGVFDCPLVVTMRPVPAEMVTTAAKTTHLNPHAHGAPIHIGDPALLGIRDLSRPDYGDPVERHAGDVPVFWACGVTAVEAIRNSKPLLAFSHSPGSMFLTDIPDTPLPTSQLSPCCFLISQDPLLYSLASEGAVGKIRQLEKVIGEDPGNRGIKALFVQDELLRSCLALSHSTSVAITTGFPTHYMNSPPDETDGPPGALAMATMLIALGKQVTMVTDKRAVQLNQELLEEAVRTGVLKTTIPLVTFEDNGPDSALHFLCHEGDPTKPRFDHLVAIERSGRAADGNYYNMRGANIKHLVDPIDDLFVAAADLPGITTIGIGDGGNELGMGKVKEKVKDLMPNGSLVACDVAADYAITAGVSNWGGYAVACALYLLYTCPTHQRYLRRGTQPATSPGLLDNLLTSLPSVDKEEAVLSSLVRLGVRSGGTGNLAMEVDALPFHPTHSDLVSRLVALTLDSGATGTP